MTVTPYPKDRMPLSLRDPSASSKTTPAECISIALSTFVPGPAELISPEGHGVSVILLTLKKMGFKIVPMERADFDGR